MLKVSFITNLCRKNRLYTVSFIMRRIREWLLEFAFGPSFGKVGPAIFCKTTHRRVLRGFGEMRDPHCIPSILLPCFITRWLFYFINYELLWNGRDSGLFHQSNRLWRNNRRRYGKMSSLGIRFVVWARKPCAEAGGDYIEWWYK
jgi:hypothetical protein